MCFATPQVEAIDKAGCDWIHIDVMVRSATSSHLPTDNQPQFLNQSSTEYARPYLRSLLTYVKPKQRAITSPLTQPNGLGSVCNNHWTCQQYVHNACLISIRCKPLSSSHKAVGSMEVCMEQDGRFVPNITIGPLIVDALRPVTDLPLDVHLVRALNTWPQPTCWNRPEPCQMESFICEPYLASWSWSSPLEDRISACLPSV